MSYGDLLAHIELFADLPAEDRAALGAQLRRRRYPRGAVLFLEGDPGTCLYLVERGQVKMVLTSPDGREFLVAVRGPGECFGEMSLLDGEPRSADAMVIEDAQLLILQREDFLRFLEGHPATAIRLLAILTDRLRRSMRLHQEASFLDVGARIASAVLRLAQHQGPRDPSGGPGPEDAAPVVVQTHLTQAELAATVGVTRESANKWLQYFERRGLLRWEKGRVLILRPEELRQRAS
jgi:CRP/FNR family cyclic AMP-dependent transcriptional regulator